MCTDFSYKQLHDSWNMHGVNEVGISINTLEGMCKHKISIQLPKCSTNIIHIRTHHVQHETCMFQLDVIF